MPKNYSHNNWFKWFFFSIIILLFAIGFFCVKRYGYTDMPVTTSEDQVGRPWSIIKSANKGNELLPQVSKISFDVNSKALLGELLKDDFAALLRGDHSALKWEDFSIEKFTTAVEINKAYKENEVAADEAFKGKVILLIGRVVSIRKDFIGKAYVQLQSENIFETVFAYFAPQDHNFVYDLKPNNKIGIACVGAGFTLNTPIIKDCVNFEEILSAVTQRRVQRFITGHGTDDKVMAAITVLAIAYDKNLPENSKCFSKFEDKACQNDIKKIDAMPTISKEIDEVKNHLLALGLVNKGLFNDK